MERFLFIVDERLPLELVAEVLRLRDDVYEIYRRPVEFANLLTKLPVKGSDFTKKGEIIRKVPENMLLDTLMEEIEKL